MSLKYLNLTGLSTLVSDIKTWVLARIPTKTSEITNDSGFLTSHQSLSNYVTLNSNQTITEHKTFKKSTDLSVVSGTGDYALSFQALQNCIYFDTRGSTNIISYGTVLYAGYLNSSAPERYGRLRLYRTTDKRSETNEGYIPDPNEVLLDISPHYKFIRFTGNVEISASGTSGTDNYIKPITTNVTDLGTSSNKWKNVYATAFTGDVTGNCSGSSGSCTGNAATATQFSANKAVTLTGDVTGTASSKAGWSVATTLANSGVTAGSYGPTADVTGNNNATISVPQITVDAKGRVTSVTNRTLTCKNNTYNVYNKTLTIQKNGTNVATFTSNSNTDVTANITVPTKTSELTNDSGFLTSHQSLSNYSTLANTVKSLSISGKTITVTPGSGSAYTLTTQDTVYTHPTSAGNKHVPSGGSSGQFLGWASDGTAKWVNNPNTNTDTLVNQNVSTANNTYPVLIAHTANATANLGAKEAYFGKDIKINPSTGALYATKLYSNNAEVLTSHQSLAGYLPLTGGALTGQLNRKNTDITKGTNPSSIAYWAIYNCDKNGTNYKNNCLGLFETSLDTAGVVSTYIRAMKNTASNNTNATIGVIYDTARSVGYGFAPTPAANDNTTKIATTAWVQTFCDTTKGYLTSHQSLSNYSTKDNTVKSLSISGKTITVTPGSGSAYTLTTQDTVYTHPTTAGNKHIPSGGSSGQILKYSAAGTAAWANVTFARTLSAIYDDESVIPASLPFNTNITCVTSCPLLIFFNITTNNSLLLTITLSNVFVIATKMCVGSQTHKQDDTTYGTVLSMSAIGSVRGTVLAYPWSTTVKLTMSRKSGTGSITASNIAIYQ